MGHAKIGVHRQDLKPKPNVFFSLCDPYPVFEDRVAAGEGREKWCDLIRPVHVEKVRGSPRIAAFPRSAVRGQPRHKRSVVHRAITLESAAVHCLRYCIILDEA